MGLDVGGRDSASRAFLDRYQVAAPSDGDVTLAALEIDGRLVAQTTGKELFAGHNPAAKPLTQWLSKHKPKMPDAKELLAAALADAKRENKCVLLLENAPGASSGYCCRLNHYVEQYKSLIEKDYVVPENRRALSECRRGDRQHSRLQLDDATTGLAKSCRG